MPSWVIPTVSGLRLGTILVSLAACCHAHAEHYPRASNASEREQQRILLAANEQPTAKASNATAGSAVLIEVPPGWQVRNEDGSRVFSPKDLREGEFVEVRVYPEAGLAGAALDTWLQRFASRERPPAGEWADELKTAKTEFANLATGSRAWVDASKVKGVAAYSAVSADNGTVRLTRLLANKSPALQRHQQTVTELMQRIAQGAQQARKIMPDEADAQAKREETAAVSGKQPAPGKQLPASEQRAAPAAQGGGNDKDIGSIAADDVEAALREVGAQAPLRLGGMLKPGAYRCTQRRVYRPSVISHYHYTLNLYEDSSVRTDEASIENSERKMQAREYTGTYEYKEASGALFAGGDGYDNRGLSDYAMMNFTHRSIAEERNLVNAFRFVTDARGQAFFYGLQEIAHNSSTVCVYRGAPKQASPIALARAKREQADAERYKYRTKPGAGLKLADIECFWRTTRQRTDNSGLVKIDENTDLLLKNGWAYGNVDYSPHDLNAAASLAGEPKNWYRWKREGGTIAVAKNGESWTGESGLCGKAPSAHALIGVFEDVSAASSGVGQTAHIHRSAWIFGKDGTFRVSNSASTGMYFDAGAEDGTYSLDGYTLELRFKDGTVQRRYAYTWGNKDENLVIGGRTFSRPR